MKKSDLLNYVGRYHLAGATTSVKWVAKDGKLETEFITDDQNVIGSVSADNLDFGNSELGVYATPQVVKMLSAVGEDLSVDVNKVEGTAVSVGVNDNDVDMTFMLADLSVIRQVPDLKNTPDWNATIKLDDAFINKFIKAKNALPESENFGIKCSSNTVEIIMNYSSINTNRIKFGHSTSNESKDMGVICFSSSLLKEILLANKGFESGQISISEAGLAQVNFKLKNGESTYYLVQLQTS